MIESNCIRGVDKDVYVEFVKHLFTPKKLLAKNSDFETIRLFSMKSSASKNIAATHCLNNSRNWLPPKSVLEALARLVNLYLAYQNGVGKHNSVLPNFLENSCLVHRDGELAYDFGADAREDVGLLFNNK